MVICHSCQTTLSRAEIKIENRDLYGRIKIAKCPRCEATLGMETF